MLNCPALQESFLPKDVLAHLAVRYRIPASCLCLEYCIRARLPLEIRMAHDAPFAVQVSVVVVTDVFPVLLTMDRECKRCIKAAFDSLNP